MKRPIKIIFGPSTKMPINELIELSIIVEKAGFDGIMLPDLNPAGSYNDTFLTLAALAISTKQITLGTAICNPYTRHPAMIARAFRTLYDLSNGRVVIGIGAGGLLPLSSICYKSWKSPLRVVEDSIIVIRRLLNGEKVTHKSITFSVCNLQFKNPPVSIPIFIGARRAGMLRLAERLGDGVILSACSEEIIEISKKYLMDGLKKVNKDLSNFSIVHWTYSSISKDLNEAKELIKKTVAQVLYYHPIEFLERTCEDIKAIIKIRELISSGDINAAKELVTDEMIDRFSLTGTPEEIIEKIERQAKVGITHLVLGYPIGKELNKTLKLLKNEIIPHIKDKENNH
ncbi:MAG: LLM class flavin-dependent oxidoreductase [Candidatus Asgardarchaeia archaeon]